MNLEVHDNFIVWKLLLFMSEQVFVLFFVCAVNGADCIHFPIREVIFGMLNFIYFMWQFYHACGHGHSTSNFSLKLCWFCVWKVCHHLDTFCWHMNHVWNTWISYESILYSLVPCKKIFDRLLQSYTVIVCLLFIYINSTLWCSSIKYHLDLVSSY